ncbi:collagen binding domain-containing protein [Streptomyces sp. NPDC090131]|uniref:MSCRAMM family protein n=1 Tax=Streptomyces sp. NPDC090131 TaxID=3365954 RepID=UPI003814638C
MAAGTARVWPLGLAAAVVLAAAAPARSADRDGPTSAAQPVTQPVVPAVAPAGSARVVLLNRDQDTGAPLPGARFELWRETNDRPGLQSAGPAADEKHEGACVTDARGSCTVELAVNETYYWLEAGVPAGYERPEEPVTGFDLQAGTSEEGLVLNVANRLEDAPYGGLIRVRKKDAKTEWPLHGAVFELWKETNRTMGLQTAGIGADHRVRPGCATDADGICDFDRLADGWYYVAETDVPEGYVMPKTPVTAPQWLDGETPDQRLVVTLHNRRDDHGRVPAPDDEQDGSEEEAAAGRRAVAPSPGTPVK